MDLGHCVLDGNADAVEFCPHDPFQRVLAASTYTLHESSEPKRTGSISLFDVDAEMGGLELTYKCETAGIFDIKWSPVGGDMVPLLAQADADGYLRIHRLGCYSDQLETQGHCLEAFSAEHISSSMCLCLDWNSSATSISVGLSDGSVSIASLLESQLTVVQEWKAHDFELWATCFDYHQPQLVYTGSDDCKFSCWDLRDGPSKLVFQNSKIHKMGICCITKNPSNANTLLTGSYDEHLRVWDLRSVSRPIDDISICLGGGVWRIKHHPSIPDIVLTACMHNGFSIVKMKGDKADLTETYKKHGSLAYGADWQRGELYLEGKRHNRAVATCSFYDRLLRVWIPQGDIFG